MKSTLKIEGIMTNESSLRSIFVVLLERSIAKMNFLLTLMGDSSFNFKNGLYCIHFFCLFFRFFAKDWPIAHGAPYISTFNNWSLILCYLLFSN